MPGYRASAKFWAFAGSNLGNRTHICPYASAYPPHALAVVRKRTSFLRSRTIIKVGCPVLYPFNRPSPGSLVKLARTLASLGAAVVVAIVVIPFFLSSELVVSRTVLIKSSPADAWDLVVNLERHPAWHPWDIADSFPRLVFGETRHGAEASYFWIGSRGNHGMLKFEEVNLKERTIVGVLDMSSLGESRIAFRFVPSGNGVQVTEIFRKHTGRNIFRRYLHPVYRTMAGRQLEGNLARLKQAAEGNPLAAPAKQRQP